VVTRLRDDQAGFGLIELLIAMTILNIGMLALVASLNSGMLALTNAGRVTTASVIAERQLELYRGMDAASIGLRQASVDALYAANTVYTCDVALRVNPALACSAANRRTQLYNAGCANPPSAACNPSRTVTGPDGASYRVDTYVVNSTPQSVTPVRAVKLVTVVVRNAGDPARVYARHQSTFDEGA